MATLPTYLLIDAAKAKAAALGLAMTFVHRGDRDSGQILLSFYDAASRTNRLRRRERNWETGDYGWVSVKDDKALDAQETSAYIERATNLDPDLWVIEIESGPENSPFDV